MKMLGIEMPLKELETIYNEFAKKIEEIVDISEKNKDKKWQNLKIIPNTIGLGTKMGTCFVVFVKKYKI